MRVWDVESKKLLRTDYSLSKLYGLDLSTSESMMATCHKDDIRFWSAKDGKKIREIRGAHDDIVASVRFTPDEN
eukprot:CAMPEP_0176383032 /NCGR_PEP_ID=MMETSP0126-20121128/33168_1 /TAXON_ID=141414 ORGANISM="Strombidinopsis acuminatum, Strain SPMC142" /NCGR_SAMPLE_ID=MMETSP0126 /ASSEMBLY_ACC=CAM_ASM_000229 /LENGTH=73 /DNA_ID=CAMNT_0017747835 /DNA_START=775 /DNA_END=996 /DNA_ORIENTATION=-